MNKIMKIIVLKYNLKYWKIYLLSVLVKKYKEVKGTVNGKNRCKRYMNLVRISYYLSNKISNKVN